MWYWGNQSSGFEINGRNLKGDEDYGTTGSEFYSYPYSGEAFNIVLNASKCKEKKITKISKVQVTFYDLDITADYQDISGIYREANWQLEYDSYMCTNQDDSLDIKDLVGIRKIILN